jgi:hypothetical protein
MPSNHKWLPSLVSKSNLRLATSSILAEHAILFLSPMSSGWQTLFGNFNNSSQGHLKVYVDGNIEWKWTINISVNKLNQPYYQPKERYYFFSWWAAWFCSYYLHIGQIFIFHKPILFFLFRYINNLSNKIFSFPNLFRL